VPHGPGAAARGALFVLDTAAKTDHCFSSPRL
jgi:hypothetical protein